MVLPFRRLLNTRRVLGGVGHMLVNHVKVFLTTFAKAQFFISTTFSLCCRCVSNRPWGNEIHNDPYVSVPFPHQLFYKSTPVLLLSQKHKLINNATSKTNSQAEYSIPFPYSSRAHAWSYHWLCRAITCLSAGLVWRPGCSKISWQD